MLAIELTLNVYVLAGIMFTAFILGFMLRRKQLRPLKKKVYELEKEMLSSHAEILELQRTKALLNQNMHVSKIPVIPLNPTKDESSEKVSRK